MVHALTQPINTRGALGDGFGRHIDYVRVSITDRCNLRCTYCMAEQTQFAPRHDVLSFQEIERLIGLFAARGVRHIRVTGGEPMVRKDFGALMLRLGAYVGHGLNELTLTTNGTHLAQYAPVLWQAGVRRINVSLDTIDRDLFAAITRRNNLAQVQAGIIAARGLGFDVRVNAVALAGNNGNVRQLPALIQWAHGLGASVALIETMPLGEIGVDRASHYVDLGVLLDEMRSYWHVQQLPTQTHHRGPARYYQIAETGGVLGVITPMSNHFCATCNRVRLTATGQLHLCLGQDDGVDLRGLMRAGADDGALSQAINEALAAKPLGHEFAFDGPMRTNKARTMAHTGG